MAPATRLAALVLLPTLALGACGQSAKNSSGKFQGEQQAVAKAIEELQSAGSKGDAARICSQLLAPALVDQINKASKRPCDKVLKDDLADVDASELQVQKVNITGDRADAVVESQAGSRKRTDTLQLQKVGGAWKIAKLSPLR
jgi:Putative lumazine-binding